jgi:hypothetical protein
MYNQNLAMQQNLIQNNQMPEFNAQNNNNIVQNQIVNQQMQQEQLPQENEKLPLNQRMVMVPNPLLLAMQNQNIQPKIQQELQPQIQMPNQEQVQNPIIVQNQEEQKNNELIQEPKNFKDKMNNLEKMFSAQQNMPNLNNQNQNILVNQENNVENNIRVIKNLLNNEENKKHLMIKTPT